MRNLMTVKNGNSVKLNKLLKWGIIICIIMTGINTSCASNPEAGKSNLGSQIKVNISDITGKEMVLADVQIGGKSIGYNREELINKGFTDTYTITFNVEMVSGVGAPNRYSAPYTAGDDNSISIKMIRSTMMATFLESEKLKENEYFSYLQNTYKWNIANDKLELYSKTETGAEILMIFSIKP